MLGDGTASRLFQRQNALWWAYAPAINCLDSDVEKTGNGLYTARPINRQFQCLFRCHALDAPRIVAITS